TNLETKFWYKFDEFVYTDDSDDDHSWSEVKKYGLWYIDAVYSKQSGEPGYLNTQVIFTPEPISSALFLLGGVVLGMKQYKKRKKDSI
ncbi:hypothetical protein HZA55_08930, partial [Candidatus Poribacteria bacterium]|nr:hypothetical protein [Candidatus Poribacteria bacterium]